MLHCEKPYDATACQIKLCVNWGDEARGTPPPATHEILLTTWGGKTRHKQEHFGGVGRKSLGGETGGKETTGET